MKSKKAKTKKRLFKNRMYRSPYNGRYLWYFDDWAPGITCCKVMLEDESGLANVNVSRSKLAECEIVTKGQEPWLPNVAVK